MRLLQKTLWNFIFQPRPLAGDAMMALVALILIGAAIYCTAVYFANLRARPEVGPITSPVMPPDLPEAADTLTVMTWNIGYGALGKNADLIIDKGKSLRALSATDIRQATASIAERLAAQTTDVICLQENANAGFLNRGVPVRQMIEEALDHRHNLFWSDMRSVLVPPFLHLAHGMSVHARVRLRACTAVLFPQDDTHFFGGLKKHYGGLISRISIENEERDWVVFNIHLSAFDPDTSSRLGQLQDLLDQAQQEYQKGHFVVIAGDWNMRLIQTDFAHQTDAKDFFLMMEFPQAALEDGWTMAVDAKTPTVRSMNTSYVAGQNHTTIIDGFVCSPNVAVTRVSTADLGFENTDHHPVEACFKALK